MRKAVSIALLAAVFAAAAAFAMPADQWAAFKSRFARKYKSAAEEAMRRKHFERNMERLRKVQAANPHATFGMNELSDRSEAELKGLRGLRRTAGVEAEKARQTFGVEAAPKGAFAQTLDWRTKGAVTGVKNQAQCGDCWSFSTTGSIEGQWFLAGNSLVSLSEQELTSCDTVDQGCNGGLPWDAMGWLINNTQGWITSEAAYPFASQDGIAPACSLTSSMPKAAQIYGYTMLPTTEAGMAAWAATNGPISIGVDATSWQSYTGGILTTCSFTQLDHAVLIVGYDLTNSPPYWIIKNSWGTSWGEAGYIRVSYGSNQCGLANMPSSAKVHPAGPTAPPTPSPPTTPAPPATPAPPTTAAPSAAGTFTQYVCPDWTCLDGCQGNTFNQGQCLGMTGGGSAVVTCTTSNLVLTTYNTTNCAGPSQSNSQPVDQCLADTAGSYIYNVCTSGGKNAKPAPKGLKLRSQ